MRTRVFIILAAVVLLCSMSLSIQAYERPPGWDNLKIDDSYEDHPWSEDASIENPNISPQSLNTPQEFDTPISIPDETVSTTNDEFEFNLFDLLTLFMLKNNIIK